MKMYDAQSAVITIGGKTLHVDNVLLGTPDVEIVDHDIEARELTIEVTVPGLVWWHAFFEPIHDPSTVRDLECNVF